MNTLGKTVLTVVSLCFSGCAVVVVTIADVTGHWGSVDQSGTLLRVPWKTKAEIGLWETCIHHVSGFPREEVSTSSCVSTLDSGYMSKDTVRICQSSLVLTSLLSAVAMVLGLLYIVVFTNKLVILIATAAISLLSVVTSTMGVSVFVKDIGDTITMDWSLILGIVAALSNSLATCGYWCCVLKTIASSARVQNKV